MKPHQISYVWMNFGVCILILISFIFFALNTSEQGASIWKYHDTISSFCAKENSWENKFLLFLSVVISLNLSFLHFEEYNARDEVSEIDKMFFMTRISFISVLMMVGVLYVPGKDPNTVNKDYDLGTRLCRCSIKVSSWLHSIFALSFMLFLTASSAYYAYSTFKDEPNSGWTIGTCIWSLFSIVVGTTFIAMQSVLYCYDHLVSKDEEKSMLNIKVQTNLKIAQDDVDENGDNGVDEESLTKSTISESTVFSRTMATKVPGIRVASFVLEIVWLISIVLQDGVCSVYRNKLFPHFGPGVGMKDYVPFLCN